MNSGNVSGAISNEEYQRMADHASAIKANRQSLKRRERNRSNLSRLRTALKKFNEQVRGRRLDEAGSQLPALYALVDRSVQRKVISRNAAARQKSRLTIRLNAARAGVSKG